MTCRCWTLAMNLTGAPQCAQFALLPGSTCRTTARLFVFVPAILGACHPAGLIAEGAAQPDRLADQLPDRLFVGPAVDQGLDLLLDHASQPVRGIADLAGGRAG